MLQLGVPFPVRLEAPHVVDMARQVGGSMPSSAGGSIKLALFVVLGVCFRVVLYCILSHGL